MANVKNVLMKKKIEGVVYDLLVKTSAEQVVTSDGKSLATALTEIFEAIANKATVQDIDDRIDELVNGAPEAFDTLKEIADYIEEHQDAADALNAAIGNKVEKVEGKGLSTNDFTDDLKAKLEGLSNFDATDLSNKVNAKARILVSETEPTDLTENDIWLQEI